MVNYNRLLHILNRGIEKKYIYSKEDIKNCFNKTSYNNLIEDEEIIVGKMFKEIEDAEDIDFIIQDLNLNKENIKNIYKTSPYNNEFEFWNNYFKIPHKKEIQTYIPISIDKILSPSLKKIALEKLAQGYEF